MTALVVLNVSLWYIVFNRDRDSSVQASSSQVSASATPAGRASQAPQPATRGRSGPTTASHRTPVAAAPAENEISLTRETFVVGPHETVRIAGTLRRKGSDAGRRVRVEMWRDGAWWAFPLTAVTGPGGRFTAYVDLGVLGKHRLRVVTLTTHVVSDAFTITVV
jgi:hypothetical protein